ncbi:MAG: transposase [Gemmatimonadetes bacterium]|nr:transposase [Gemmatimonadota bacterium]
MSPERQAAVLRCLVEGNSIRATVRLTGAAKNTVVKLLRDVGSACLNHHDRAVQNVSCRRVQCDEIWAFVGSKEKNTAPEKKDLGWGDVWTWTAIDQDSKLVLSYEVGDRDPDTAQAFAFDLAGRLANRVQLTTDGLRLYLTAVEDAFGREVDYAMLVKMYSEGGGVDGARRYSPARYVSSRKVAVTGDPVVKDITTSHVERSNLTMRMSMRRFTRLTNAFSKKSENHLLAVALHFSFYNYCRPHMTLNKRNDGKPTTPAMAAGLADRVWTVYDLLGLAD